MEDTLQYAQIVKSPTFVSSGSLIDHIYIDGNMLSVVHNSVVSVYYSDHELDEAIKVQYVYSLSDILIVHFIL